ncbi:CIA30 family protein [Roseovarius dicentrarchi]|uniref:CIA30 family protein n=1 Tax=Roseovarius dicentrarchi TaxID=2250573 RepID=UPI001EF05AFD|nr:CIA30 family protein [Roseovarius dicentrarchi]
MIEDFSGAPETRWEFISDRVMGGRSTGQVALRQEQGQTVLHLSGSVSTAKNGGFIQARLKLPTRLPEGAKGLEIKVKGNGQTYYIHARTGGTVLPWNFYQAPFDTSGDWQVLRIPFARFEAQGMLLRDTLAADSIKSLAIVAYGRDHTADISVADIAFY